MKYSLFYVDDKRPDILFSFLSQCTPSGLTCSFNTILRLPHIVDVL